MLDWRRERSLAARHLRSILRSAIAGLSTRLHGPGLRTLLEDRGGKIVAALRCRRDLVRAESFTHQREAGNFAAEMRPSRCRSQGRRHAEHATGRSQDQTAAAHLRAIAEKLKLPAVERCRDEMPAASSEIDRRFQRVVLASPQNELA